MDKDNKNFFQNHFFNIFISLVLAFLMHMLGSTFVWFGYGGLWSSGNQEKYVSLLFPIGTILIYGWSVFGKEDRKPFYIITLLIYLGFWFIL